MHPDVDVAERDPTNLSSYIKVSEWWLLLLLLLSLLYLMVVWKADFYGVEVTTAELLVNRFNLKKGHMFFRVQTSGQFVQI